MNWFPASLRKVWMALIVGICLIIFLFVLFIQKPTSVDIRFLGYQTNYRVVVAQFWISNKCDFPVKCFFVAGDSNCMAQFDPFELRLRARSARTFQGLAGPFTDVSAGQMNVFPAVSGTGLPTNRWFLRTWMVDDRSAEGFGRTRMDAAIWLHDHRLGWLANVFSAERSSAICDDIPPPTLMKP